jgi:hypothetical protein
VVVVAMMVCRFLKFCFGEISSCIYIMVNCKEYSATYDCKELLQIRHLCLLTALCKQLHIDVKKNK